MARRIADVLHFRDDISPFLIHFTKRTDQRPASEVLEGILREQLLKPGAMAVSDVRYGGDIRQLTGEVKQRRFGATCFSETPISQAHCLLEIEGRQVNLEPFGMAFVKERLERRGVSPALYLNNIEAEADAIARALFRLSELDEEAANRLLPLFAVFGQKLQSPNARARPPGNSDWRWEREWRLPAARGPLAFTPADVFVGFCPDEEIERFESIYETPFIDPRRPMEWYATKLIRRRRELGLTYSVV